jgi:hypothetical protein
VTFMSQNMGNVHTSDYNQYLSLSKVQFQNRYIIKLFKIVQ